MAHPLLIARSAHADLELLPSLAHAFSSIGGLGSILGGKQK